MLIVVSLVASVLSGLTYLALGLLVNMTSSTSLAAFFWRDFESPVEAFLRVSLIAIWPLVVVQPVLLMLGWIARRQT